MPEAVSLATKLLNHFKQRIASFEMVPSGGGRFEIDVDGQRIYSKLDTGQFPEEDAILQQIEQQAASK